MPRHWPASAFYQPDEITRVYIDAGDEQLVLYSLAADSRITLPSARLSAMANALECYLKAILLERTESTYEEVLGFNHDLYGLIERVQKEFPRFTEWFNLVPKSELLKPIEELTDEHAREIGLHGELYQMIVSGRDLSYRGLTRHGLSKKVFFESVPCEDVLKLIRAIREIMTLNADESKSNLNWYVEHCTGIPEHARAILKSLV